jgi:hypothetical protein
MAVRLSAPSTDRALIPRNIIFLLLVLIAVRQRLRKPQGLVWTEGLDKLKKKKNYLIWSGTHDLPDCSIVP